MSRSGVWRRFFSLSMSDPSPAEALAIVLGLILGLVSVMVILYRAAYEAALYATPISPYSNINPYIPGFINPPNLPGKAAIAWTAAGKYPELVYKYKLQLWVIWAVSILSALFPLVRRIRSTVISSASIMGRSPMYYVWLGLVPVVIALLGQVLSFGLVAAGISVAFYGVLDKQALLGILPGVLLFGLGLGLWFYVLSVVLGRLEVGSMSILLLSLVADRIVAGPDILLYISAGLIAASLVSLYIVLERRWMRI